MKKENEQAQWASTKSMLGNNRIVLGPYFSYQFINTPRRVLYALSYHKFAAKLIGPKKRILEVGCSEGLATLVLAELAEHCTALDFDLEAINFAKESLKRPNLEFIHADILDKKLQDKKLGKFDAATSFDVIEHIFLENEPQFFESIVQHLQPEGMCVIGTPNITSNQYASPLNQASHVNLYSAERLQEAVGRYFKKVIVFSANDEVVHTGFSPMAHYLLAVGIGLR